MADNLSPDDALQRLLDGNKRHVSGSYLRPHQSPARRIEVADTQRPFAIVFGCSDSRVPPEIVFDQGLGDLFVVRTAGHVLDSAALASIAFGVEHAGCRLVMVLGHRNCGAVSAVVEGHVPAYLAHVADAMQPVLKRVKLQPSALLDNAIRLHTGMTVQALRAAEPVLSKAEREGVVRVVGAYYDLCDGGVSILE